MAAKKKAQPVAHKSVRGSKRATSHTRRKPAGKRAQVKNPAQVEINLDTPRTRGELAVEVPGAVAGVVVHIANNILDERGQQYQNQTTLKGTPAERHFQHASQIFNATRGRKMLTGSDIALVLQCVKMARHQTSVEHGKPHFDSAVDGVNYMALHHEESVVEMQQRKAEQQEDAEGTERVRSVLAKVVGPKRADAAVAALVDHYSK